MATKPTVRIPLPATDGGAAIADPGLAAEQLGVEVDKAYPAHRFNWTQNAQGQWLGYYQLQTDENETNITANTASIATNAADILANQTEQNEFIAKSILEPRPAPDALTNKLQEVYGVAGYIDTIMVFGKPEDAAMSMAFVGDPRQIFDNSNGVDNDGQWKRYDINDRFTAVSGALESDDDGILMGYEVAVPSNIQVWQLSGGTFSNAVTPTSLIGDFVFSTSSNRYVGIAQTQEANAYSIDNGFVSWTTTANPVGALVDAERIGNLRPNEVWISGTNGTALGVSDDGGLTWTDRSANLPPGNLEYLQRIGITSNTYYATTSTGVYTTTGEINSTTVPTWTQISTALLGGGSGMRAFIAGIGAGGSASEFIITTGRTIAGSGMPGTTLPNLVTRRLVQNTNLPSLGDDSKVTAWSHIYEGRTYHTSHNRLYMTGVMDGD